MPDVRLKASAGEEQASRAAGAAPLAWASTGLSEPPAAFLLLQPKLAGARAQRAGWTGPRVSGLTYAPADAAPRIAVPAAPCAPVVHPRVVWGGLPGLWDPWRGPRGNDAVLGTGGGCWRMSACLDFERTPLRVMIYWAVPERWLTHQGARFGTGTLCAHRTACTGLAEHFAKALQVVLQFVLFHESQVGLPSWMCWSCYG